MNDVTASLPADAADSQVITPADGYEHGRTNHMPDPAPVTPEPAAPEKLSTRDAIAKAIDDSNVKPKVDDKPTVESADKAEPDVKDDAKAEVTELKKAEPAPMEEKGPAAEDPAKAEPDSAKRYADAPQRFLPEARAKWANVPNEIKAEFHRVSEETERELSDHRQFREGLREYEDLSKQHNVTIKDTLDRYVNADRQLNSDFGRGVAQLSQMYGKNPNEAIASIISAYGITPQQYANHIISNPSAGMAPQRPAAQQQQQQAPQQNPEVAALRAEIEGIKREASQAQVMPIIQQAMSSLPDFNRLAPQITRILDSGVLNQLYGDGLTHEMKLREAYRMAGGSLPSTQEAPQVQPAHSEDSARLVDPDGKKSIKGAPGAGQTKQSRKFSSNREALEALFPR